MDKRLIEAQSKAAYGQWAPQWREHAKAHSKFIMKPLTDFEGIGVGKAVLCVANGYSFEQNIETIKKYQHNVDIVCCDKTLGTLLDNGIIPKICIICDANVDYQKYMEKWKDKLSETIAIVNICGNPKWTENGNWKDVYFFINKDIINSHLEFSKLSGCNNFIPAGTNVSNAMVIILTQSDNDGRRNFFGYDKILLIGFDYSWQYGGKYYAYNEDGDGKSNYMKHMYVNLTDGSFGYTSGNLAFSAEWFETYVRTFNLPVLQCSNKTILKNIKISNLEEQIQYRYKPEDGSVVNKAKGELRELVKKINELQNKISNIERDHWNSFIATV